MRPYAPLEWEEAHYWLLLEGRWPVSVNLSSPFAWEEQWVRHVHFHDCGCLGTRAPENLTKSGVCGQTGALKRQHQDQKGQSSAPVLQGQRNVAGGLGQERGEAHHLHAGLTDHDMDVQEMVQFQVAFQTGGSPGGPSPEVPRRCSGAGSWPLPLLRQRYERKAEKARLETEEEFCCFLKPKRKQKALLRNFRQQRFLNWRRGKNLLTKILVLNSDFLLHIYFHILQGPCFLLEALAPSLQHLNLGMLVS